MFTAAGILVVLAVGETYGLPAMFAAVFILYLLCIRLERRRPLYFDGEPLARRR